jgi:hypothetical protein
VPDWTGGRAPHAARQITLPTAHRQLLIYMCCDVCALLLGGSRIIHPLAASAISETLARATQTHSVRPNCSAQRRYIIAALLPGFAFRLPPILPRIPMFGCQLDDRRLPFTWLGEPRVFEGYCVVISSIAGEQPKVCRSAHGDPSNRSLRSNGRHSDGNATAPPDSAAVPVVFLSCYVFATDTRLCGCAGLSYPSHSTSQLPQSHGSELHGASETRPCSFTLAQLAYWYDPAVCAKMSFKTRAFGR